MWRRIKKGVAPSRGTLNDVMKKLHSTYQETGGNKWGCEDDVTEGLSPFDALKIVIVKKLKLLREAIKDINRVKGREAQVRKKNDVRQMIRLIEIDYSKMKEIHERLISPGKFFFKKKEVDKKLVSNQKEDLDLIFKHIKQVKDLYRKRFDNNVSKSKRKREKIHQLTKESDDDDDDDDSESADEDLSGIAIESEETLHLPAIDISQAMLQVKKKKNELAEGMSIFSSKLDTLKEQATDMGYQIQESSLILGEIEDKTEKQTEEISTLTKKTEKASKKISGQTKLLLVIILLIFLIVAIVVIYIVLISTGVLANPLRS